MRIEHISEHTLRRFFEGRTTRQQNRQIVAHLLGRCGSCAALARTVYRPTFSEQAYDEVFDRVARRLTARFGAADLPALKGTSASLW